ncbi:hypothetical protein CWB98_01825 [Pseudoalteromonas rubra]|uniref:Uncharacterized protein n=1 Tax=Pseudoalteromonas rubra TaxID=43658 RepID=A0A5S3X450_9GAMM|nr:hypothetical protein CWB98_01825 [Pseudoalteromonas rubra]
MKLKDIWRTLKTDTKQYRSLLIFESDQLNIIQISALKKINPSKSYGVFSFGAANTFNDLSTLNE